MIQQKSIEDQSDKRKVAVKKLQTAYRAGKLTDEQIKRARSLKVDLDYSYYLKVGVNDLATTNPELAAEWHPTKNGNLKPSDMTASKQYKAWWLGKCGHVWQAEVGSRNQGTGCPYCSNQKVLAGFNDLATTNPEIAAQWHPTKNGDLRPAEVAAGSNRKVWWRHRLPDGSWHEWEAAIVSRTAGKHGCPYCSNQKVLAGFNDLATTNPEIAAQWHPTKNGDLRPSDVVAGSTKKVWWRHRLPDGSWHEWEAKTENRTCLNQQCPICSNQSILQGFNDLASQYPELAAEWHPTKNGDLRPSDVVAGSTKKVWWRHRLPDGSWHEWEAAIVKRARSHRGCPYCSNKKVLAGFNDLATINPDLAAEWHPTKNGDLRPSDVVAGSAKKVWWRHRLPDGSWHEWEAAIVSRTAEKHGCPYCSNQKVLAGFNDLATTNPEIAAQWHPTKNGDLRPSDVVAGSTKKVWWRHRLPDGSWHEWEAAIVKRARSHRGCPYCSNKKVLAGFNDLATINPDLAAEWHPTKNGDLRPSDVVAGSAKKVWWRHRLPDGSWHEWEAAIVSRTAEKHGCPYCSNQKVLAGFNDLATTNPEIAAQWHPTKNGDLRPSDVVAGSTKKVWWLCSKCGHPYRKVIRDSIGYGVSCPECTEKKRKTAPSLRTADRNPLHR